MKRPPLYSPSRPATAAVPGPTADVARQSPPSSATSTPPRRSRRTLQVGAAALALAAAAAAGWGLATWHHAPPVPTQRDIDAAVKRVLRDSVLPSPQTRALATVSGSIVRVTGLDADDHTPVAGDEPGDHARMTGTGVVIVDNGTILTSLHVVRRAERIRVTFADGHESEAILINAQPQNDLAVLRARSIPDDLAAATLRSSSDLRPGEQVVAVGFPYGIGPSASAGIVSGLGRQFTLPQTGEKLSNLIQFDAAANPGNSGGPLVTMDGSVVGIVTAILNPGDAGTSIGIGFAMPIERASAAAGLSPF